MKRSAIFASCCALAVSLMAGCGSDKKTTNPTPSTGDPNDPNFLQAQEEVFSLNQMAMSSLSAIYNLAGSIGGGSLAPATPISTTFAGKVVADTPVYHEDTKYWYYELADTSGYGADTSFISVIDSVQFLEGTVPVQYPAESLVTAVKVGTRGLLHFSSTGDSLASALTATIAGAAGALPAGGAATIDGGGYFRGHSSAINDTLGCAYDFNFNVDYDNLALVLSTVFENGGCPTGGSVTHAGTLSVDCNGTMDTLDYNGQWTAKLTFAATSISYSFSNGTTHWAGTTTCSEINSGVAAYMRPFSDVVPAAK